MGGDSDTWWKVVVNKLGRLANGIDNRVRGPTQNNVSEMKKYQKFAQSHMIFLCDYRPLKLEPYRVRLTGVGDILEYHDDALSPSVPLLK